jgi:hypothetical protein
MRDGWGDLACDCVDRIFSRRRGVRWRVDGIDEGSVWILQAQRVVAGTERSAWPERARHPTRRKKAEKHGATAAYPPTHQGQRGTFAILFQGDVQHGPCSANESSRNLR